MPNTQESASFTKTSSKIVIKGMCKGINVEMLKLALLYVLGIRGLTLKDELRILLALLPSIVKLRSPGYYIPGSRPLYIKTWDGYKFIIRPKTTDLGEAVLLLEQYELKKWFLPNVRGIFVDVGANVGGYTVRACKYADLIVAIEPQSEVFELLSKNIKLNCCKNNVILIKKAIGDTIFLVGRAPSILANFSEKWVGMQATIGFLNTYLLIYKHLKNLVSFN